MRDELDKEQRQAEKEFGKQIKIIRKLIDSLGHNDYADFKSIIRNDLMELKAAVACRHYKRAYGSLESILTHTRNNLNDRLTVSTPRYIEGAVKRMYEILDVKIWGCFECCSPRTEY